MSASDVSILSTEIGGRVTPYQTRFVLNSEWAKIGSWEVIRLSVHVVSVIIHMVLFSKIRRAMFGREERLDHVLTTWI